MDLDWHSHGHGGLYGGLGQLDTIYGELAEGLVEDGQERLEEQWEYTLRLAHELLLEVGSACVLCPRSKYKRGDMSAGLLGSSRLARSVRFEGGRRSVQRRGNPEPAEQCLAP